MSLDVSLSYFIGTNSQFLIFYHALNHDFELIGLTQPHFGGVEQFKN